MTELEIKDVHKVADLARLKLKDDQVAQNIASELNNILKMVKQIQKIDTAGIQPMDHPYQTSQRLRKDEITEKDQREKMQKLAPEVEAGLFLVPKVVE